MKESNERAYCRIVLSAAGPRVKISPWRPGAESKQYEDGHLQRLILHDPEGNEVELHS